MGRYFVEFAYDGTDYHGWQIQPNGNSVQEELQKALSISLEKIISQMRFRKAESITSALTMERSTRFLLACGA